MPTRYYTLPANITGPADAAASYLAEWRRVQDIEAQVHAQEEAEQEQRAIMAGGIGLGALGGFALAPAAVASSAGTGAALTASGAAWAPAALSSTLTGASIGGGLAQALSGGGVGAFQGAVADVLDRGERDEARRFGAEQQSRGIRERAAADVEANRTLAAEQAYIERYGVPPPRTAEGAAALPALSEDVSVPPARPGGMPMPVMNPAAVGDYRKAQQIVAAHDNIANDPYMPADQRSAALAAIRPQLERARSIVKSQQPPPPPTTERELVQSGAIIRSKDGGVYERGKDGYNYKQGAKSSPYQDFVEQVSGPLMEQGANPIEARAQANKAWMYAHFGGSDGYDAAIADGHVPYIDKDGDVKTIDTKKGDKSLFDQTLLQGFKPTTEGEVPFADDEKRRAALNGLAAMGALPPGIERKLRIIDEQFKAGDVTLEQVRDLQLDLLATYGKVPDSLAPAMTKYVRSLQPQDVTAVAAPSEKSLPRHEVMRRERLGLPTQESLQRSEREAMKAAETAAERDAESRLRWEKYAKTNTDTTAKVLEVVDAQGRYEVVERDEDLVTQVKALKAAGYSVPGLDGEDQGRAPRVNWADREWFPG